MSPRLKPLILPQLVEEERRTQEIQHNEVEADQFFHTHNSSSSDLVSVSPSTPAFSRCGHSRCSGSVSSLEMPTSSCPESPATPSSPSQSQSQTAHANTTTAAAAATKSCTSPLPDLQEDPLERDEEEGDATVLPDHFALRDCFCDEQPLSDDIYLAQSAIHPYTSYDDVDYDLGFLSETDWNGSTRQKRKRDGSVSSFWSTRLGSRLPGLSRWRSTRKSSLPYSPASDPSLDQHPGLSRAASSRSSSVSARGRRLPERSHEPPLPETPALSLFESSESIDMIAHDEAMIGMRASLERERSMATTPLLPPLLTEKTLSRTASLLPSPLQSPAVLVSPNLETFSVQSYPTPPLSTKVSVSSFRRGTLSGSSDLAAPPATCMPPFLDDGDAWSDRLGHANYTIVPKPYAPDTADVPALMAFREAWDLARVNYTKHLARTGEHYGTTSKTYTLTQAKWAETERAWLFEENDLVARLTAEGSSEVIEALRRAPDDLVPATMPRIMDAHGKFPERGDVDIVGPMVRDAVMAPRNGGIGSGAEEKRPAAAAAWLRGVAERMGLRR